MRAKIVVVGLLLALLSTASAAQAQGSSCEEHFDSTFDLIQKVIFERRGCTSSACHIGPTPAGGLDLSAGAAYDGLVDHPVQSIAPAQYPGIARVVPGYKGRSLLWLNLASATLPDLWQAPLRSMPQGGLPALTLEELGLIQMWIENGATRDGVVPGTGDDFDACLPPPRPLKTQPLQPPPPGVGVQIRAPRQVLPPNSEREVCFVSYYDLSNQVPEEYRGPEGTTFRYNRVDPRQDPLSHHATVIVYTGSTPIHSPVWGPFACRGGERDGQPCEPTGLDSCGGDAICASPPVNSLACIGFGPGDAGIGVAEESLFTTMGTASTNRDEGIYEEASLKGIMVWNSHAFNLANEPADLDIWVNFEFAAPEEQVRPRQRLVDTAEIFKMRVPPFGMEEICRHLVLPPAARVLDFMSHTHKRGKRFRIFEGKFACQGGPNDGAPCSPFGPDPGLPVADLCAGASCHAFAPPRAGDCNGNLTVSVDELVLGVAIALGEQPISACMRFDGDGSGHIAVDELVGAVVAALRPANRDPEESLFYTTLTYADPLVLAFDPPRSFGDARSSSAERTLTYCALYDNGFINPEEVKRRSRVPTNGGPCRPTHCAEGLIGQPCTSDVQCDSSPGAGDGFCDACMATGGITTDDEMFVLAGSYVVD